MSISMDAETKEAVRAAAEREGVSVSAWLADAAAAKLRQTNLRAWLDDWEREHGAFTEEELEEARIALGLPES